MSLFFGEKSRNGPELLGKESCKCKSSKFLFDFQAYDDCMFVVFQNFLCDLISKLLPKFKGQNRKYASD